MKLRDLLENEKKIYEGEIETKKNTKRKSSSAVSLIAQAEMIKRCREEMAKKESEKKLYQHWKNNHPQLIDVC